jgi:hypothetical protein
MAFLAVTRTTQALDRTGTAAAAHAVTIQLWQLGGVFLLAMSTVASIIVPSEIARGVKEVKDPAEGRVRGKELARAAANRLLAWGFLMGGVLSQV